MAERGSGIMKRGSERGGERRREEGSGGGKMNVVYSCRKRKRERKRE